MGNSNGAPRFYMLISQGKQIHGFCAVGCSGSSWWTHRCTVHWRYVTSCYSLWLLFNKMTYSSQKWFLFFNGIIFSLQHLLQHKICYFHPDVALVLFGRTPHKRLLISNKAVWLSVTPSFHLCCGILHFL